MKDGKRNGHGAMFYAQGVRVEADWAGNTVIRPASVTTEHGVHYDGGWDGGAEGHGVATKANGDRYDGEWHKSLPDGAGVMVRQADGAEFKGQWRQGCFVDGERHAAFFVDPSSCPQR